jgi:SAM-dependent methyltransferase
MPARSQQAPLPHPQVFAALCRWYRSPLGSLVAAEERAALRELVEDLFGYHLVQVGAIGADAGHLAACPIRHKVVLSVDLPRDGEGGAVTENFRLPLATDSIDVVIFPHVLEFSVDPYHMLREADRILIPGGRLLVCGFNPLSLCGIRRWWPTLRREVPWSGRFLSYNRLEEWMSLMGLEIERSDVRLYRPPVKGARTLRRFAFLDRYGSRWWPMFGGLHVVRAVKRESLIRPIESRWKRLRPVRAGAIEPTTRGLTRG